MKLLGVSGSVIGFKTMIAVNEVLDAVKRGHPEIETELLDLKEYDVEIMRGYPLASYNSDTWDVVKKMQQADFFVIASPIYQASISGVLKNLFDHLPEGVFKHKAVAMLTTGGTEKHFLVSDYHLKPILSFFQATVISKSVFVHNDDFNEDNEIVNQDLLKRIQDMAEELVKVNTMLYQN